jgi:TolB-like protein
MHCLEKRPADRPQQATEIVQALDAIATPSRVDATPPASRRKPSRALLVAIVLLAASAGIAWLWARRASMAAATTSSARLLIAPFENLTDDARFTHLGRIISDRLVQTATQRGSINVVPQLIVLGGLRDTTGGLAQQLERLATATQATQMVTGTASLRGDSLVLVAQLIDSHTSKVISVLGPLTGPATDPYVAIDSLGDRLLGALGFRQIPIVPKTFRAPKLRAAQAFAEGFQRFALNGDFVGSRPYFARAIAIDPEYTTAYQLLGRQYFFTRQFDSAAAMVQRIEQLPQGLTPVEQLQVNYMKAELSGDFEAMLRTQSQIAKLDPGPLSFALIGAAALAMLRPDTAIAATARIGDAFVVLGGFAVLSGIGAESEMYHQAGQYARENEALLRRRPEFPEVIDLRGGQLRAFAGLGNGPAAIALADTILTGRSDPFGSAASWLTIGGLEFRAHGGEATARRLLTMARTWYASNPSRRAVAVRTLGEGIAMLETGMPDSAATLFLAVTRDTTAADSVSLAAAGYLGLAEVARGDTARARTVADSLGALDPQWRFGGHLFWQAAIVGALGDKAGAVDLLQRAHRAGQGKQSWHYSAALESLHGYAPFSDLVRPRR